MKEIDMTYFTDTHAAVSQQPSRIAAFFAAIALKARQRKAYRTTYNELYTLTARDLADLGMSRGDFRRLSREAAEMVK
ncbi:hypothetical protein Z949_2281 [Sulfitobacter guttiformis KCTC 32187]|uniref:Uncharacterized protein DUF1127 n=2 Tax=Sulfitobacter guttiformis TaxID=74349 RepID=A0A420DNC1_9RHOB|nr:hypothetical protein Z949_2281 [Sulfitobacter guttiformis KCTC 32187]RKE95784.1 uncharacterized protein DUF1127 [Sulfitobacter guttiformis]